MLFYVFFNIGISGQLTQYSKTFPKFCRAATVPCALFTVDVSQWRGAHSLYLCSVNILEHTGGMSQFMYFSESKPKFLSPNSFSTMAQITPTVSLWKYKRRQRTDKKHLRYSVCIHTHMWLSHGRVSLAGQRLWAGQAE